MRHQVLLVVILLSLLSGCIPRVRGAQSPLPVKATLSDSPAQDDAQYTASSEATIRYATAFRVEYHPTYKVVKVHKPWRNANVTFTYILVRRGTPAPADTGDAQVIEIPVRRLASLAATHLPYLEALGDLGTLVAVGNAEYVNTPGVADGLKSGKIQPVGNGPDVNIEKLLAADPEMVTTLALGNSGKDDYQVLTQKGLKPVIFSDFMEETPLARAEWVKFIALFFDQEEQAEKMFSDVEERYLKMKTLADGVKQRPTVLLGFEINGNWNVPGGRSYQAAYVEDAGGDYLWSEDQSSGRMPMSFEAVLEKGINADFWFDQSAKWQSAEDILAADTRYENFHAFQKNRVFNNNARLNASGGNDYNGSGLVHPEKILADLISIMHPELIPDHTLEFYRPIKTGSK